MPLIGSHATVTGGVATGGLAYAAEVGAEVIQVFVSNPRGWAAGPGDAARGRAAARVGNSGFRPRDVHDQPGLGEPGGGREVGRRGRARAAPRRGDRRARRGGAHRVRRRLGRHRGTPAEGDARERALRQIGEIALPLLDKLGDDDPDLLFEPMAGQGQMLCARAGDLATYLSAVEYHPKAGVCLDTCHLFAAGHDLTADGGVAAMLGELGTVAGGTGPGTGVGRGEAGARQRLAARLRVQARPARDDRRGHDRHRRRSASCSRPCPTSRSSLRRPAGRRGTPGTSLR